jgi:Flp pilus assembly protein TadD
VIAIPSRAPAQDASQVEKQLAPGIEALKSGDLDTAEQIFREAQRSGVQSPMLFHNLGVIAQQRGKHVEAVRDFRQAIHLEPGYAPSHLLLGVSLMALGKNAEATPELKSAVRMMPAEPQVHLQLAKAYEASDNWMGAVEELRRAVEIAPQEPEYSYLLGKAWMKVSEWSYQRIAHLNPDSARLHQALGQEYAIQGRYDLAIDAYQQAAHADPKLPEIHLALAVLLLESKKLDDALKEAELELKLVPESRSALETKAKIESAKLSAAP